MLKNLLLFHSKWNFYSLSSPEPEDSRLTSVWQKYYSVSEHYFLQQVNSLGRSPIQILTRFSLAELQVGGLKHNMYVCLLCMNMVVMICTGPTEQGLMQRTLCRMGSSSHVFSPFAPLICPKLPPNSIGLSSVAKVQWPSLASLFNSL